MEQKKILTQRDIFAAASAVAARIVLESLTGQALKLYGVPRGGIPALYAVLASLEERIAFDGKKLSLRLVDTPEEATIIIDDVVDSGATRDAMRARNPFALFLALYERGKNWDGTWLVFPWEGDTVGSVETNITRILQFIGEDVNRGGLAETPKRVVKAWREWSSGYGMEPADVLKTFEDGAEKCDEMVVVRDIPFYSHCEHHMAPFFGTATVAYIPNGKIVGLSKIPRLVEVFARRLQVQERLTNQIADAMETHLDPKGVGVMVTARHLCMESRGICKQGSDTVTSALRGVMRAQGDARAEFMAIACK